MRLGDIEIVRELRKTGFQHVLFDFDGTISLLREGWQGVMQSMMAEMICGDETLTNRVNKRIMDFINKTTGYQTIIQMDGVIDLIREFNNIPEEEILDAQAYRKIYNDALMLPVNVRLDKLSKGEVTQEKMCVKGARDFVEGLATKGASLYIFSGTNEEDVRNEAELLGLADHFKHIWGALRTIEEYSKEKILKELIEEHGLEGPEILIVGDGPVEIQLARQYACKSVGVASNEAKGGLDVVKRDRLWDAGADIIVPDFKCADELVNYLFEGAPTSE
ncbi:MAG: HAD hydrolase-like protein [Candidatus Hydrogenedentota bacterium]